MSALTENQKDEVRMICREEIAAAHAEEAGEELREAQQDQLDMAENDGG